MYCRDRSDGVIGTLCVPCGNADVEQRIRQNEKKFDLSIQIEVVSNRDVLSEAAPVPRWGVRARTICPIFGNPLLSVGEVSADFYQLSRLLKILFTVFCP